MSEFTYGNNGPEATYAPVEGIHTGNIKDVTTQSKAGLGTQGPIQTHRYVERLPAPQDMDLPD